MENLVKKGLAGEPHRDLSQEELDKIWLLCGDHLGGGGNLRKLRCLSPSILFSPSHSSAKLGWVCQRQGSGQTGLSSDLLLAPWESVLAFHPLPPPH